MNPSRSERGWQGRRRIAVLVSLAAVLGVAALGSASTVSAATVADCNAKLEPKANSAGTKAKLSFVCDGIVRAYGIGSNRPIKSFGAPSAGAATAFLSCQGVGVGFGCGIPDRAAPGTQAPGTTGWNQTSPGKSTSATATPTTCNGFSRIQGDGTPNPGPNINAIVTGPCTQVIAPGTKVVQSIKLGSSPCSGGPKNPLLLFLFVGGEPGVTSFVAPVTTDADPKKNGPGGESTTVGEYISAPIRVNLSAYKQCLGSGKSSGGGKGKAKKSAIPPTTFPVTCSGSVAPATTPAGSLAKVSFACNQNIRAFAIYSNKLIVEPGEEPEVTGDNGGKENEGALHQCEGDIPGYGYGCGIVDRQTTTAPSVVKGVPNAGLPNGQGITAGNTAAQKMAFEFSPCKRPGEPRTKVWVVPMGEPATSDTTVGAWIGAPQPLAVAYGKCTGGKGKGGKTK